MKKKETFSSFLPSLP